MLAPSIEQQSAYSTKGRYFDGVRGLRRVRLYRAHVDKHAQAPKETMMQDGLFSLAGKSAFITGGNGGIGRALALGFQAAGAQVAVTGRNPEKNASIAAELGDEAM